jgi:hypothetical protein
MLCITMLCITMLCITMLCITMLCITMLCITMLCIMLSVIKLSFVMPIVVKLSVFMLNVFMLNVIVLSVVAPRPQQVDSVFLSQRTFTKGECHYLWNEWCGGLTFGKHYADWLLIRHLRSEISIIQFLVSASRAIVGSLEKDWLSVRKRFVNVQNKLKCFSLSGLSSLI